MVDFMYIGASRAGSTWLYKQLNTHPQVKFPLGKPVRFWNAYIDGKDHKGKIYPKKSIDWYQREMDGKGIYKIGDITDGYTMCSEERIQFIAKCYPNLKIIYGIRDPIDTIVSHISLSPRDNIKDNKITETMVHEIISNEESYLNHNTQFEKNKQKWINIFGEDAILVYQFEDITRKPLELMKIVSKFIGIDPAHFDKDTIKAIMKTKINSRKMDYNLTEGARLLLEEHFVDYYSTKKG